MRPKDFHGKSVNDPHNSSKSSQAAAKIKFSDGPDASGRLDALQLKTRAILEGDTIFELEEVTLDNSMVRSNHFEFWFNDFDHALDAAAKFFRWTELGKR